MRRFFETPIAEHAHGSRRCAVEFDGGSWLRINRDRSMRRGEHTRDVGIAVRAIGRCRDRRESGRRPRPDAIVERNLRTMETLGLDGFRRHIDSD
jgi:hypothetical protein